jgi:hypothetical protein
MKKLPLCLLFLFGVLSASSQKVYFVYIQAESEQPFFVKMNEKVNSSTGSGYIILSKLVDSTYNFSIGFPQNKWPEQQFSVAVNKKDHGYLLKNFGEKGWGLFDLQTLAVQMAITGKASVEGRAPVDPKDVSAFTEMLAKAADDPSLREKPAAQPKPEEKKADPVVAAVVKKEEVKPEVKETITQKTEDPAAVTAVKKEEPKPEVKETVSRPVEATVITEVKKDPNPVDPVVVKTKKTETKTDKKEPVMTTDAGVVSFNKEEPKQEQKETVAVTEKPVEKKETPVEVKEETYQASTVKKWAESSTTEGFGLIFIDGYSNGTKDTIRLVIPNPKPAVAAVKEEPKEEKKFIDISTDITKKEEPKLPASTEPVKEEKKEPVVEAIKAEKKETVTPALVEEKKLVTENPEVIATEKPVTETPVVKNACKEVASGDDFVKLRKRMVATETDDDMIAEAKKYFKSKCFSTWQLKNLGVLFLTDEGKYKFFDASYPYVTDAAKFGTLQTEMKDEYYVGRFKAMLRN